MLVIDPPAIIKRQTGGNNYKALVIEDTRVADDFLPKYGVDCTRITHSEFQGATGQREFEQLLSRKYDMVWVTTPRDFNIQTKKAAPHGQKLSGFIRKAADLNILLILYGPPCFLWKDPTVLETIKESNIQHTRLRFCAMNFKYDKNDTKPSGSYMFVASNSDKLQHNTRRWGCSCTVPIDKHVLDWTKHHGDDKAKWKKQVHFTLAETVYAALALGNETTTHILDTVAPPSSPGAPSAPTPQRIFPTEGRVKQKKRLAEMKEKGEKVKKRKIYTEPGNDDCGEDITSLGKDLAYYSYDQFQSDSDTDEDLHHEIPFKIAKEMHDGTTNVFSAVATLCCGRKGHVDLIELCGGEARISQVAFKRSLISGGNLDLVTGCDLGDPTTQRAVNHYLANCNVMVAILQPNCRTTGRNSYYNSIMNYDTWKKHHVEDLPHIKYCGEVAHKQMKRGRYFMREQPLGTWIDDMSPWYEIWYGSECIKTTVDQCMAGCVDKFGQPVRKATEWMANHEDLLHYLATFVCDQMHDHGHPTGKELEKLNLYPWKMCQAVVAGIIRLKNNPAPHRTTQKAYPSIAAGTDEVPDPPVDPPAQRILCCL